MDGKLKSQRTSEIDGLRGWASVSVLIFHVTWEMFGKIFPDYRNIFTGSILNGAEAVSIFFVISGQALSASFWRNGDNRFIYRLAVKRYFRLTIPVFFSCALVLIVIKCGILYSRQASYIVGREDWLGVLLTRPVSFVDFMKFSFIGVYKINDPADTLNPFLWTMRTELIGSGMVFLFCLATNFVHGKFVTPVLILLATFTICVRPWYSGFFVGMLYARLSQSGVFVRLQRSRAAVVWSFGLMLLGTVVSSFVQIKLSQNGPILPEAYSGLPFVLCATVFLFGMHCNQKAIDFMRNAVSQYLGKISFSLYLVHFPVLISLISWLTVVSYNNGEFSMFSSLLIAFFGVFFCFILAEIFLRVERVTQFICNGVAMLVPYSASHPSSIDVKSASE